MEEEKFPISIVGKELFSSRMGIEKEFGDIIYDQIIFVLENIATENHIAKRYHTDIRLGVYLDSNNEGVRVFEISADKIDKFYDLFANKFFNEFKKYTTRQQKIGTNILFQLNKGNISMSEFEKNL